MNALTKHAMVATSEQRDAWLLAHCDAFAAAWWDIGLVATPARSLLALASIAHDAVDEWRAEWPGLLRDVPCAFELRRRSAWHSKPFVSVARAHPEQRVHFKAWLAMVERREWQAQHWAGLACETSTTWLTDDEVERLMAPRDIDPFFGIDRSASSLWNYVQPAAADEIRSTMQRLALSTPQPHTFVMLTEAWDMMVAESERQRLVGELNRTDRQRRDRSTKRRRKRGRR